LEAPRQLFLYKKPFSRKVCEFCKKIAFPYKYRYNNMKHNIIPLLSHSERKPGSAASGVKAGSLFPNVLRLLYLSHGESGREEITMMIYVENLPFYMDEEQLRLMFDDYGDVEYATIVRDEFSEESRGVGYIEMSDSVAGLAAIEALDGREMEGRVFHAREILPQKEVTRVGEDMDF
jgi:hypothetical protein